MKTLLLIATFISSSLIASYPPPKGITMPKSIHGNFEGTYTGNGTQSITSGNFNGSYDGSRGGASIGGHANSNGDWGASINVSRKFKTMIKQMLLEEMGLADD